MDLTQCRTCSGEAQPQGSLLLPSRHKLRDWVYRHLDIEVSEDNNLPARLCYECLAQIRGFIQFSVSCRHVQQKLHDNLAFLASHPNQRLVPGSPNINCRTLAVRLKNVVPTAGCRSLQASLEDVDTAPSQSDQTPVDSGTPIDSVPIKTESQHTVEEVTPSESLQPEPQVESSSLIVPNESNSVTQVESPSVAPDDVDEAPLAVRVKSEPESLPPSARCRSVSVSKEDKKHEEFRRTMVRKQPAVKLEDGSPSSVRCKPLSQRLQNIETAREGKKIVTRQSAKHNTTNSLTPSKTRKIITKRSVAEHNSPKKKSVTEHNSTKEKSVTEHISDKTKPVTELNPSKTKPVTEHTPSKTKPVTELNPSKTKPVTEHNPSKTKPVTELNPSKTNPVTEHNPTKTKPVTELNPSKTKPVTELNPSKTKPVTEHSPSKTKPVTELNPSKTNPVTEHNPTKTKPVTEHSPTKKRPVTEQKSPNKSDKGSSTKQTPTKKPSPKKPGLTNLRKRPVPVPQPLDAHLRVQPSRDSKKVVQDITGSYYDMILDNLSDSDSSLEEPLSKRLKMGESGTAQEVASSSDLVESSVELPDVSGDSHVTNQLESVQETQKSVVVDAKNVKTRKSTRTTKVPKKPKKETVKRGRKPKKVEDEKSCTAMSQNVPSNSIPVSMTVSQPVATVSETVTTVSHPVAVAQPSAPLPEVSALPRHTNQLKTKAELKMDQSSYIQPTVNLYMCGVPPTYDPPSVQNSSVQASGDSLATSFSMPNPTPQLAMVQPSENVSAVQNTPQMVVPTVQNTPQIVVPNVQNAPHIVPNVQNAPHIVPNVQNTPQIVVPNVQNTPQIVVPTAKETPVIVSPPIQSFTYVKTQFVNQSTPIVKPEPAPTPIQSDPTYYKKAWKNYEVTKTDCYAVQDNNYQQQSTYNQTQYNQYYPNMQYQYPSYTYPSYNVIPTPPQQPTPTYYTNSYPQYVQYQPQPVYYQNPTQQQEFSQVQSSDAAINFSNVRHQ